MSNDQSPHIDSKSRGQSPRQLVAAASVEATPLELARIADLRAVFPASKRVYITSLARVATKDVAVQAARLSAAGMIPVPHLAARRFATTSALRDYVSALHDAGCTAALVIGGGQVNAAGIFDNTMDVLTTGLLEQFGINDIAVGGHPEGNPVTSDSVTWDALERKNVYARQSSARVSILTQFCFDPQKLLSWERLARDRGNRLSVTVGIAGLTNMSRLLKFAAICGVGASAGFLRRQTAGAFHLARRWDPTAFTATLATALQSDPDSTIGAIHFYPFGALSETLSYIATAK